MKIRFATPEDAERLLEIYSYYVENTAITFEWTVPSVEEFRKRIEKVTSFYPYILAEDNGKILGYAYASRFRERKAYDWCVETSIYVDKDCRRLGLGSSLLNELERLLKLQGITNVNASITTSSTPGDNEYVTDASQHFHEKHGYHFVAKFSNCGYKFNRWFTMIFMEKIINEYTFNQSPVKGIKEIL
ncbi:MAG: N-acetyltransferase [Bacteroidales bacterium]|nr:N-acetyltransferase [Bacteroidales bacterium]